MAEITVPEELAERIREIARRENRSPDDVLKMLIDRYVPQTTLEEDETFLLSDPRIQEAMKRMRPKFYARARAYWQQTNDQERLALTDEQLDEQFWLFDKDGIPRLKSDAGKFERQVNPLVRLAARARREGWKSGRSDTSENFDAVLDEMIETPQEDLNAVQ